MVKFIIISLLLLSAVCLIAKQDVPREYFEWTQLWREASNKSDKPHVLIIGDSICNAYRNEVQENLKDLCYVDKLATSRSLDQEYYFKQIDMVVNDEDYDLIIFNFGLHGFHINGKDYYKYMDKLAKILINTGAKVVCLGSTPLYYEGDENKTKLENQKVYDRNIYAKAVAKKNNIEYIDWCDLWLKPEYRAQNDAFHYNSLGVTEQAKYMSNKIRELLK